jgi:hypothetical protein
MIFSDRTSFVLISVALPLSEEDLWDESAIANALGFSQLLELQLWMPIRIVLRFMRLDAVPHEDESFFSPY